MLISHFQRVEMVVDGHVHVLWSELMESQYGFLHSCLSNKTLISHFDRVEDRN